MRLPLLLSAAVISCVAIASFGQSVLRSGEAHYIIRVQGGAGVTFSGSYLVVDSDGKSRSVSTSGGVPIEIPVVGKELFLTFQNGSTAHQIELKVDAKGKATLDTNSPAIARNHLEVELIKNGSSIKRQRTNAPFGVISLSSVPPRSGSPRQTEIEVSGSAKFAYLTFTSETGDTQQELVPIPFSKTFFPHSGWTVGVLAQKVKVTRPDPLALRAGILTLSDGESGTLKTVVRVNGRALAESDTSIPYGIASATVQIP